MIFKPSFSSYVCKIAYSWSTILHPYFMPHFGPFSMFFNMFIPSRYYFFLLEALLVWHIISLCSLCMNVKDVYIYTFYINCVKYKRVNSIFLVTFSQKYNIITNYIRYISKVLVTNLKALYRYQFQSEQIYPFV